MDERIISKKLEILKQKAVLWRQPISGWAVRLAAYGEPGEYTFDGDWAPLVAPALFPALKTVFLRVEADCPPSTTASGKMYLQFSFDQLEGALSVDGAIYAGLDRNHSRVPLPDTGSHVLDIEFMSVLRAYCQPELREERSSFMGATIVEIDQEVEGAYYDFLFGWQAIRVVTDPTRKAKLAKALESALFLIDLTVPLEGLQQDVARARALFAAQVGEVSADPEGGCIYLVGHTHIDTAWLWPLSETVRKCGRTFATAVRLMEQFPDFHFSCSQAQLYDYTRNHYPQLYKEIANWVSAGRWHTTGAMWVESDCNVPSGESLIRQFIHGLRFYETEFGTRPRTCWLPDVFGYPGSLPQILAGCGIPYFLTCKLHWQSTNPVPNHLFWWEGVDGSRVLAHIPKLRNYYNGSPDPEQLIVAWDNFAQRAEHGEVLFPFGYGDGGGGVTAEMMESLQRSRSFPGLPATRTGGEEQYFGDALDDAEALPVWQGELYLETHRGTYTTQSRTKQANRATETMLREAEIWGSIARSSGAHIDMAPLQNAWRRVLRQQFHDILPGSSIHQVYDDALADYEEASRVAHSVQHAAVRYLTVQEKVGGSLCVFNSLSWPRCDPVEAIIKDPGETFYLVDSKGRSCPVQVLERVGEDLRVLFEPHGVPAMGFESYVTEAGDLELPALKANPQGLENELFRVELDDEGALLSLLDKRFGREVIPSGEKANVWQLFQDGPEREAAWNVHDTFEKRQYPFVEPARLSVVEQGPVRIKVRVARAYRNTRIQYDIALYRRTPRLDFVACVDWQERQTLVKVAFPVTVRSSVATYEIQFGAVQRATHRNTSWEKQKFEVCAHRWADLSETGYGVSLLNDSRYGYDVKGNVLRLTLLRGPEYPDPEADLGKHEFVYSLLPHGEGWAKGETVRRARELNTPMIPVTPTGGLEGEAPLIRSYCQVTGQGVVLETLKPAEDGDGWLLRLYESLGGREAVRVQFEGVLERAAECNLVEEMGKEIPVVDGGIEFDIKPFEIRSFRVWLAHQKGLSVESR